MPIYQGPVWPRFAREAGAQSERRSITRSKGGVGPVIRSQPRGEDAWSLRCARFVQGMTGRGPEF